MRLDQKSIDLMVAVANKDLAKADVALDEFVSTAIELPLRAGLQDGDIISEIFTRDDVSQMSMNTTVEYPLHFMEPGTEGDYVAFTLPTHNGIPERLIESDYVQIPVFDIGNGIDWDLKYMRAARFDVMAEATKTLRNGFIQKQNDDGFHTLLAAAADRGVILADSDAAAGDFSVRLVSLMQVVMRRNGGGNSSSMNRSKLTDLIISPECMIDMRSWNVDVVDELTRREIFTTEGGMLNRIFGVNMLDRDEFGEGQKYQLYFENVLNGTMPTPSGGSQKLEIVLGLDLSKNRSFVMPVQEDLQIRPDNQKLRQRKVGVYGWLTCGYGVLDGRDIILGAV